MFVIFTMGTTMYQEIGVTYLVSKRKTEAELKRSRLAGLKLLCCVLLQEFSWKQPVFSELMKDKAICEKQNFPTLACFLLYSKCYRYPLLRGSKSSPGRNAAEKINGVNVNRNRWQSFREPQCHTAASEVLSAFLFCMQKRKSKCCRQQLNTPWAPLVFPGHIEGARSHPLSQVSPRVFAAREEALDTWIWTQESQMLLEKSWHMYVPQWGKEPLRTARDALSKWLLCEKY